MSTFIQLHILTSYPPANLNRDDLGRPKTAVMGGVQRLRVSSQSLKRAWRCSDLFQQALAGHVGTRTKAMGKRVLENLIEAGVPEKNAKKWAQAVAGRFGALKKDSVEIEQLAHFDPKEIAAIDELVKKLAEEQRAPKDEELNLLGKSRSAVDIAMFGRMLADQPVFDSEAAVQVSHAITVHKAVLEDDYFTAVDDLNKGEEERGAAHIGETEFAAGLFYLYVCINRNLLLENLGGDEELAAKSIRALAEAALKVAPTGKQNSFASRAYASYALVEKGGAQPRSLSVAFLKSVQAEDQLAQSVEALNVTRENMDRVYGQLAEESYEINASKGEGDLEKLLDLASSPLSSRVEG